MTDFTKDFTTVSPGRYVAYREFQGQRAVLHLRRNKNEWRGTIKWGNLSLPPYSTSPALNVVFVQNDFYPWALGQLLLAYERENGSVS